MAKKALYTLMEDEEVIFELNIDNFETESENGGLLGMVTELLGLGAIPIGSMLFKRKATGVFVVTNMRCFVVTISERGLFCNCCEDRNFFMFPRTALNGCNGYEKSRKLCCAGFSISVGITVGASNETLTIVTDDIDTDEQAQAVVAKLATLIQKA